jgi:hypothetical protein
MNRNVARSSRFGLELVIAGQIWSFRDPVQLYRSSSKGRTGLCRDSTPPLRRSSCDASNWSPSGGVSPRLIWCYTAFAVLTGSNVRPRACRMGVMECRHCIWHILFD